MIDDKTVERAIAGLATSFQKRPKPKAKPKVKRPGYREAVAWIAYNDDEEIGSEGGYIVSIMLVADLFGKEPDEVARAVEAKRKREGI